MVEDATIRIRLVIADEGDAGKGVSTGRGPGKKTDAEKQAAAQEKAGETISSRVRGRLLQKFGLGRQAQEKELLTGGERRAGRRRALVANAIVGRLVGGAARSGLPAVAGVAGRAVTATGGGVGLAGGIAIGALAIGAAAFLAESVLPLITEAVTTEIANLLPVIGKDIKVAVDAEVQSIVDDLAVETARIQTAFTAVGQTLGRERARALLGGRVDLFGTFGKVSDILTAQKALQKKARRELDKELVRNLTQQALGGSGG